MTQLVLLDGVGAGSRSKPIPIIDNTAASGYRSIQATVTGVGAVSATVVIYGCNDKRYPKEILRFGLAGDTVATDMAKDNMPFEFYIADVETLDGTAANVSVVASV